MNIFKYEIKQYWKSTLGWAFGISAIVMLYMPFLGAFLDEAAGLQEFFDSMSVPIYEAMGLNPDLFFGNLGFYGFIFVFIYLAASIQAVGLGLGITVKETQMKTADFLLSKPKTRTAIYLQKGVAALFCIAVTQGFFCVVSAVVMNMFNAGSLGEPKMFWLITLSGGLVQLFCLGFGFLLGTVFPKIHAVTQTAVGVSLVFFVLTMVSNLTGSSALRWVALFKYFDSNFILYNGRYEAKYLIVCLLGACLFFFAGLFIYRKKDIDAV